MLSATIQSLSKEEKEQIHAKIGSTDMRAFPASIRGNITRNYGSYVGRDFKLWIQLAVFILQGIVSEDILRIWELISEVKCKNPLTLIKFIITILRDMRR